MTIRTQYLDRQPIKGETIMSCIHMTIQAAALIEARLELGAEIRRSSCNIFSTQEQVDYSSIPVTGPFTNNNYKY